MRAFNTAASAFAFSAALAACSGVAFAQDALTVELEGKLLDVDSVNRPADKSCIEDTDFIVKIMGATVIVPNGMAITTPTASMPAYKFFSCSNRDKHLPGVSQSFIGGTAIVTGTQDPNTGVVRADSFFTDFHENVLLGGVTKNLNDSASLYVANMKVIPLLPVTDSGHDPRYPGLPPQNEYGFKVKMPLPVGALTSVEGYMDDSNAMRAFIIEVDVGELLNDGMDEASVLRAQCRQRSLTNIELSVSGAAHGTSSGALNGRRISIAAADGEPKWYGTTVPSTVLAQDGENPRFYLYSYSFKGTPAARQGCPKKVTVTVQSSTASATGETDLRID